MSEVVSIETANEEGNDGYLSPVARELVLFIERFHSMAGVAPTPIDMRDYARSIGHVLTVDEVLKTIQLPLFQKSMTVRGIILDEDYKYKKRLTQRQMVAAAAMSSIVDRRSEGKRLQDLGITTAEWETWKLDETFMAYFMGRVEKMLENSVSDAHIGLIRGVKNGNVQAIKLLYEITNRYNPANEDQVNVRLLLGKLVEVIQKHVKDPIVMANMAKELTQVMLEASPTNSNTRQIQGHVVR